MGPICLVISTPGGGPLFTPKPGTWGGTPNPGGPQTGVPGGSPNRGSGFRGMGGLKTGGPGIRVSGMGVPPQTGETGEMGDPPGVLITR